MKRIAIALAALICATEARADVDFFGNIYPEECHDLSDIELQIIEASPDELRRALGDAAIEGATIFGVWQESGRILILRGMDEPLRSYVIKHERCHERMFRLTGNAHWHG